MRAMITTAFMFLVATASLSAIEVRFADQPHEFNASEMKVIELIAEGAETEVRDLLPMLSDNLVLTVTGGSQVADATGEAGMALSPGNILWVVDHGAPLGVIGIARAQLRHTLFHEFHHLARGWLVQGGSVPKSIMNAVISEGLATAFARDFSKEVAPWAEYPEEVEQWVRELQGLSSEANYQHWMFDHPDGRSWIGYRAGTFLVDRAMKNSGLTSIQLVGRTADEVVELALERGSASERER